METISRGGQPAPAMTEARERDLVAAAGSPAGRMKYRGVAYTPSGKWSALITEPGSKKKLWLGTYPNTEVAACAYDMAAKSLQGDKAKTNFTYPPPYHLIDAVAAAPGRRGPVFTVPPTPAPAPATTPPVAPAPVPFYHGHSSYKAPPREPAQFPAFPFLQDPSRLLQRAPAPAPKPEARITLLRSIPPKPFNFKAAVAASRHASDPVDLYAPPIHIVAPATEPSPASSVETGVSCTKPPKNSIYSSPPRIMACNSGRLMLKTPKILSLKKPKILAVRSTAPTPDEGFTGDNFTGINVPLSFNQHNSTLMPHDVGALQTPEMAEGI